MSSACKSAVVALFLLGSTMAWATIMPLRVCADPNNLPFSNIKEQGFENALALMVGHDLHRQIRFVWLPPKPRSLGKLVASLNCDMVMGIASAAESMATTRPYYRSTYVFITRRDRHILLASLSDRRLAKYRIGAQVIGGEDAAVPPAEELARRGLTRNLVGYSLYGHPFDNPSARMISAVESGQLDMAIAWGPTAGYFARNSPVPLRVTPICPLARASGSPPMAFSISMGVLRGNDLLLEQLNAFIARRRTVIRKLLQSYGVPLMGASAERIGCR